MRLKETLAPRSRQAPDGPQEGGSQPTDISVINRRLFLAPALPMDDVHREEEKEEHVKIGPQLLTSEVISTPGMSRAVHGVGSSAL